MNLYDYELRETNSVDLEPIMFYPLSVHKVMLEVMSYTCTNTAKVNSINLANNCLIKIEATKMLLRMLSELKTLDLRNNNVSCKDPLRI